MPYQNNNKNRRRSNSRRSSKAPSNRIYTLIIINLIALCIIAVILGLYFYFRQNTLPTRIPQIDQGLGNTPANSSNYGFVVDDEENTYLANYNKIGTIVKRSNSSNEENFVNLNTDNVNIYGLNIYADNLYFIVANNSGQQSIYQKSLSSSQAAQPLVTINRMNKNYLIPFIFSDTIFVFASDSNSFTNATASELIKYDLLGNELMSTAVDSSRITTDGQYLYTLTPQAVNKINPEDLSSTPLYSFANTITANGNEFFYYSNRLYLPYYDSLAGTYCIASLTTDGTSFETVLEESANGNEQIAFNISNNNLFVLYNTPEYYLFTQTDLNTGVEKEVFRSIDDYPNLGITAAAPVDRVYMYTAPNGVYYLRTFNTIQEAYTVGVYNFMAFNTNSSQTVGSFYYKK